MSEHVAKLIRAFQKGSPVRVVNYHHTPAYRAASFDRELELIAERFSPTSEDELATFLNTGAWRQDKPGVVIALYNGYRNNYDVFRPLLDKHGLIGWFFVVSGYVSCPAEEQALFAATHNLTLMSSEYADGRTALNWDEVRDLDRTHVIASHTRNHAQVSSEDRASLETEIVGAQTELIANLGHPVRAFAWLFGGAYGESPVADEYVNRAGYEFLFSNLKVQRLPKRGLPE